MAGNQQDPNTSSWPGASRVNFQAVAGAVYLIQVEGAIVAGVTNEGNITLNWGPAAWAGTVSFSTNLYNFGEEDNNLIYADFYFGNTENTASEPSFADVMDYETLLWDAYTNGNGAYPKVNFGVLPSLMNTNVLNQPTNIGSTASTGQGRVTLVRTGGYNGRIQVDMSLTNDFYQNTYETNGFITNIYIGPSDDLGNRIAGPATNITITITNFMFLVGYDSTGDSSSFVVTNVAEYILSNTPSSTFTTNLSFCNANFSTPKQIGNLPVSITTNTATSGTNTTTNYTLMATNITLLPTTSLTFLTPSAVDGTDFYSSDFQTVTFDDFQMSKDAWVNISPVGGDEDGAAGSGGPDWPDKYGNMITPGIPRRVILTLSNPRLDPLESLDVAAPTLAKDGVVSEYAGTQGGGGFDTGYSSVAEMTIQDFYNPPPGTSGSYYYPAPTPPGQSLCSSYSVFNFERSTFRCFKPLQGSSNTPTTIYVFREGPINRSTTIQYSVNQVSPNWPWTRPDSMAAGSEYAIVTTEANTTTNLGNYDLSLPYASPPGMITFPAQQANDVPVAITIYNNNNGAVEFDMEYEVLLSLPMGANSADVIGNIGKCYVTICSDNNTVDVNGNPTRQQPGGAADRTWNPEIQPGSYPAFNSLPGADGEVYAIAVQPDGNSVAGGQFLDYDSANFNNLVRTLTNGLPDFSFNPGTGPGGALDNNNFVSAVAIDTNSGNIYIGGNFASYNGVEANYVARLNPNGTLDTSFNTGRGADGIVWALALDPAGNVIIGGDFTSFNSTNRNHIARLIGGSGPLAGSLDASFNPGTGTDQDVPGGGG